MAYSGGYLSGYISGGTTTVIASSSFHPRAAGYGARIEGMDVRLAPDKEVELHYYTQDSLAPRSDDRSSTDENVLDLGHEFARSDLTGGSGLAVFPRPIWAQRSEDDITRYWDSMNIDTRRARAGEITRGFKLHKKLELWGSQTDPIVSMVRTADRIYIAHGDTVTWYTTTYNTTAEGTQVLSTGNDVVKMAVLGNDVYVHVNNVIYRRLNDSGTFSVWYTPGAGETIKRFWAVKERFLVHLSSTTPSNSLYEIAPNGTTTTKVDDYADQVIVNDICDGGPAIVAALSNGLLYSYILDSSQVLIPASQTPLGAGEQAVSLVSAQGTFAYITVDPSAISGVTVARFYSAQVLDSRFYNTIGESQLIHEWETPYTETTMHHLSMMATRDEIWWPVYEDDVAGDSYTSLFRFDLVTNGFNRAHAMAVTSDTDPRDLLIFEDRFVLIADGDTYTESADTYASVGWVISPYIDFGLNTDINWVTSTLEAVNLVSGGVQVSLFRASVIDAITDWQHIAWNKLQTLSNQVQSGEVQNMVTLQTKGQALQVRVYPNTAGTPFVQKFSIRGVSAYRDWIVVMPINISDLVEIPGRAPKVVPRLGDTIHTQLLNFSGRHIEVEVYNPPMTILGIVDAVSEPTSYLTRRGSQGTRCVLKVRGKRVTSTVATVGTAGVGVARVGISTVGIGQVTELI